MQTDIKFLCLALEEAEKARGQCAPNPSVGALLVRDGKILSSGFHRGCGLPHAEVEMLKDLELDVQGATAYVTLEPCCHQGRTPPCTDLLIRRGVKKVIYGFQDPNPIVAGKGEATLKAAGIECKLVPSKEVTTYYESYTNWTKTKLPFVTAKLAQSWDGKVAGTEGRRLALSAPSLNLFTHRERWRADAILSTAKTVINDKALLNARLGDKFRAKAIFLLDSHLSLPLAAEIAEKARSLTLFCDAEASVEKEKAWEQRGVKILRQARINLEVVLERIGREGIHDLWVEAGPTLTKALLKEKLLHRLHLYFCEQWVGPEGIPAFSAEDIDFIKNNSTVAWKQHGRENAATFGFFPQAEVPS